MPNAESTLAARAARVGSISMVHTSPAQRARTAAWYPHPVPTSSTRDLGLRRASSVINATMYGCEMVWPLPIDSGPSSYAFALSLSGTNACRGTDRIAWSTA